MGLPFIKYWLVAGAGSKHVSMVTFFINVVPPLTTIKQPPSLVVAVNPDEIPKVVKPGTKLQKDHLWKIVYGNKEKVLSIKEKTGEVTLRHIHCSGRHDIFVGIYAKDKKPAMTLQKITLNMTGKDLPDCSGKPRPAAWSQIPGPKLKQITVGPKAVFGMTEDGEVYKRKKGHIAVTPVACSKPADCGKETPLCRTFVKGGSQTCQAAGIEVGECGTSGDCKLLGNERTRCKVGPAGQLRCVRPEECNVYCTDEQVCGQPTKWSKVGAGLRQIDAGGNALWGLSKDDALLVVTDTLPEKNFTWTKVGSNRTFSKDSHVSVSEKDKVWTIETDKTKKDGFIGTQEDPMSKRKDPKGYYVKSNITGSGNFRVVAVGKAGVWAITQDKAVFFKRDSEEDPEKAQKEGLTKIWKRVEGAELVWISVGSHVWGINSEKKVVFRTGVTHSQPSGVEWRKVKRAGPLTQIDTMGEDVWAVDAEGKIHRRSIISG